MSFGYENNGCYSNKTISGWHETLANDAMLEEAWRKSLQPSWFSKFLLKLRNVLKL